MLGLRLAPWFSSRGMAQAALKGSSVNVTTKADNLRVVQWKLYGRFRKHNTHCLLVAVVEDVDFLKKHEALSYNEKVIYYLQLPHHVKLHLSGGLLGFRKGKRREYECGYQVTLKLFKTIEERNLLGPSDKVELIFDGFGQGRAAFKDTLLGREGTFMRPFISRITEATRLKFGGQRARHRRRL